MNGKQTEKSIYKQFAKVTKLNLKTDTHTQTLSNSISITFRTNETKNIRFEGMYLLNIGVTLR